MNTCIRLWTLGILAVTSVGLSACGGGGSAPLSEDDFCSQKADKECIVTDLCSSDKDDCKAARKTACLSWVASIKAVPNTPREFVPANIGACINKTDSVYKKTVIKPADLADMDDVCNYVFQGDVKKDEACTTKYDCQGKVICDKGFCADKSVKGKDAQCSDLGAVCGTGQYCADVPPTKRCTDKAKTGETCSATVPCVEADYCAADGKCALLLESGDACTASSDCGGAAPYCNPYAGNECSNGLTFATHSPSCAPFGDTDAAPTGGAGTGGGAGMGGGDGSAGTGGDAATSD
jgi:hypothetical protein